MAQKMQIPVLRRFKLACFRSNPRQRWHGSPCDASSRAHWYTALESNEQLVYEMLRWFDKYVKTQHRAHRVQHL